MVPRNPTSADELRDAFLHRIVDELDEAARAVESPIEKTLLWAMLLTWCRRTLETTWWASDCFSTDDLPGGDPNDDGLAGGRWGFSTGSASEGEEIAIYIQPQIRAAGAMYRLDFGLCVTRWLRGKGEQGTATEYEKYDAVFIDVECDGHDFHERTKEQASRDKKRDRDMQAAGWVVARFTGSDIYRNPIACAEQLRDLVFARQRRD